MIKNIIIASTSLIVGLYFGYKFGAGKAQKYADEQVNSTKQSLRNYYEKKLEKKDSVIKQKAEEMMPKDLGVDPGVNDEVVKDPREQFPRFVKTIQPEYKLSSQAKEKLKEYVTNPEDNFVKITKEAIDKEMNKVIKRPNDLPPTAIDTPDGYPDPEDISAEPYLIRDVDFGTVDKFEIQEFVLWNCGTVTTDDASYSIVAPSYLFKLLPEGWSNMFGWGNEGKYDDSLYFRNNREKKDIQITKQSQDFRDWVEATCPGRLSELDED